MTTTENALLTFVRRLRAACDELEASISGAPPKRVDIDVRTTSRASKDDPICKCGHPKSLHRAPEDDAKGNPKGICDGCLVAGGTTGSIINCPEFSQRGKKKMKDGGSKAVAHAGELTPCETAILVCLAQYGARTSKQIAILTGYSMSGTFGGSLTNLRASGYVLRGTPVEITDEGKKVIGEVPKLPRGEKLFEFWLTKLTTPCEQEILKCLRQYGPHRTPELAEACGYEQSGTFGGALTKLRALNLIERGQPIVLAKELQK